MKQGYVLKKAIRLRMKDKKSLQEIADALKISKSTASLWLREYPFQRKRRWTKESSKKCSEAAIRGNKAREYKRKPICELKSPDAIRNRLFKERGRKCEKCGWNKTNLHSGIIPVQVDHVDGDRENNDPANLKVVCPNCHSLTPTFMFYGRSHKGTWGKKGTKRHR